MTKNKKGIIAILVLCTMLLAMCPVMQTTALAEESVGNAKTEFSDIAGKDCEEAVGILNAVGILEGKSETEFDPDGGVTRAEMASIILRLLGMPKSAGREMPFSDVPQSHWAYSEISSAYAMGLVKGYNQNTFGPDDPVTYAQTVKMLVEALGYGTIAEASGGYPTGYLAKASQLDMLRGVENSDVDALSRGKMAMLVKNATEVEITVKASFGGDEISFVQAEGTTLLTEYLKVYKYEDVITANYYTSISAPRKLRQNEIALDGKVFDAGNTNAANLIGRKVTLYVKDTDGNNDGDVLYVKENRNVRTVVVDFQDVDPASTETELIYVDKENKRVSLDIDGAIMLFNGKLKVWDKDDLFRENGKFTCIANNGNDFTVLIAEAYKNYAVEGKRTEDLTLFLKENKDSKFEISVDTEETSVKRTVKNADGTLLSIHDFNEWDVITVAESEDGSVVSITRSQNAIKGILTELGDREAVIGDKTYAISKLFWKPETLKVGMEATFYLDAFGELAFADTTSVRSYKYGYLISAEQTKGLDGYPQIKLFTEDNEMVVYKTADKLSVNGVSMDKTELLSKSETRNEAVKTETGKLFDQGSIKEQIVRYELDASGVIDSIETARENIENGNYMSDFSRDGFISGTAMYYGRDISSFDCRSLVSTATKIFITPEAYTGYDKDYTIMASSSLVHGMENYKNVSLFDITEDNIVSVVWMVDKVDEGKALHTDNPSAIILNISEGFNDYEEVVTKIKVYTEEGKEETLFVEDDMQVYSGFRALTDVNTEKQVEISGDNKKTLKEKIAVSALSCGDVIQYSAENGRVKSINVMLRAESPLEGERVYKSYSADSMEGFVESGKNSFYSSRTYGFGTIKKVSEKSFVAQFPSLDKSEIYERVYKITGQVVLYDTKNHTVQKIKATQMNAGDKVFATRVTYHQKFIIVYK